MQYAVTLSGSDGEMRTEAALWFYAGGKAAKVANSVATAADGTSLPPAAVLELVTGAVLQIFPHDHRVPEIARFLAVPDAHASDLFGEPVVGFEAPERVRFRPGVGATFRRRSAGGRAIYVRIKGDADTAALHARALALQRAGPDRGVATARLPGTAPAIAATSAETDEGSSFAAMLTRSAPEIEAAMRRVARALTGFHDCPVETGNLRDQGFMVERAARAARLIAAICPPSGPLARDIARWIARTEVPLQPSLAHMDLKPERLILTDASVTLLDLDRAARFDGLYDIAMLEVRILSALAVRACSPDQAQAATGALYGA